MASLLDEGSSDDGVDLVMDMLSDSRAGTPPAEMDSLLAGLGASGWCGRREEKCEKKADGRRGWCFEEDCAVADVMTGVKPERVRAEVARRLPGRSVSEVRERFRVVCGEVLVAEGGREKVWAKGREKGRRQKVGIGKRGKGR